MLYHFAKMFYQSQKMESMFNSVYVQYFDKPYPARSAFGADGLAGNASFELECIAYIRDED